MKKPMTPEEINRALAAEGYSQAEIADDLEVSRSLVSQVVRNASSSHRVRCYIADKINRSVDEVFKIRKNPTKPGPKRY
jgi:transcriptional regulator with XRE-family HTH domain